LHDPSAFRAILGRGSNSSDVAMAFLHDDCKKETLVDTGS
jgi:hypothetical protein